MGSFTLNTTQEIVAPKVYAQNISIETTVPIPKQECSCVVFAKGLIPELPWGDAKDLVPNSPYPRVGGVVIINYNGTYHLAPIYDKVSTTGFIPIHDFNYKPCEETWREIHISDPRIVGYWGIM